MAGSFPRAGRNARAQGNARLHSRAGRPHRCSAGRERERERRKERRGRREGVADLGIRRRATGLRSASAIRAPARRLCSVLLSARARPPLLRASDPPSSAPALCSAPPASAPRLRPLLICSARLLHPSGPALLRSSRRPSRACCLGQEKRSQAIKKEQGQLEVGGCLLHGLQNLQQQGCIGGCDDILKELMEISRFGSRNQAATPARGQTPSGVRQAPPRQDLHTNFRPAGQLNNENPSVMHSQGFRSTHTQNPSNASDAGQVLCTSCGALCISRTANTEANRGRKFYKCEDPGCGFFKWEDELDNATPRGRRGRGSSRQAPASASAGRRGGSQARGRRGRGRNADGGGMFVSVTGDPSRCCFTCGDPSHFANACPNRR